MINAQGYNLLSIKIGDLVKLKGVRSHINGRKALVVTVTGIIGGGLESRSKDRFVLNDGKGVEYYGFSRSEFRVIK